MISKAVQQIDIPGIQKHKSGKVREIFDLGDKLLFVVSDRISAFDCVLPTGIPDKGKVLNQLSAWWFNKLADRTAHHMVSIDVNDFPVELQAHRELLEGRSMLVHKTEVLPVECIARGYLIGSGWKDYQRTGTIAGMALRPGYRQADRLDEPIFTPSTKAAEGLHDENISFKQMVDIIGEELAGKLRDLTLDLYSRAAEYTLERGIIMADTKFEFGIRDGEIMLIDEILTPDSSRFWPAAEYVPGSSPMSFDKQYVRDYLETLDWDKTPPAPALPEEVMLKTREKYIEAYRRITGEDLNS